MVSVQEPRGRPATSHHLRGPPSSSSIAFRQYTSLGLILLLFTAATPFTPVSWLIQAEGGFLFDRLFAGIALFCACYFQWRIAGLSHPLAITIAAPGGGQTLRNGRLEAGGGDLAWVWRPAEYWPYAISEALLLLVAQFGPSEFLRRLIVVGVVACLWFVGWFATPASLKLWAWQHIKSLWFWIILDEVMRVGSGRGGRRQRGRW